MSYENRVTQALNAIIFGGLFMMVVVILIGLVVVVVTPSSLRPLPLSSLTPAVVKLTNPNGSWGTGALISPRYVLTAGHVADSAKMEVETSKGPRKGTAVWNCFKCQPPIDLALVRLDKPVRGVRPFKLACGAEPALGSRVVMVGHLGSMGVVVSPGFLIGGRFEQTKLNNPHYYLVPLSLQSLQGTSGSPIVRPDGRVIGLVSSARYIPTALGMGASSIPITGMTPCGPAGLHIGPNGPIYHAPNDHDAPRVR